MKTIYSQTGKPTTATDEDAEEMIKYCGYSAEWPAKVVDESKSEIPGSAEDRPEDAHPGEQIEGSDFAPAATGMRFKN